MSFVKHLLPAWKSSLQGNKTNEVILSAMEDALKQAETDAIDGKVEMELNTATGKWLDRFGELFGPRRKNKEPDNLYRERLVTYVKLERGTIPAIKDAILRFLNHEGTHIEIYEPYTNIFYLNKSKLNGEDHLLGYYYTYAVIDIKITTPFPESIMDVIRDFKPAGVKVYLTYRPNAQNANASVIEASLTTSEVMEVQNNLTIMNGLDDRLRGHLNLTNRARKDGDESGLFITNKSSLNSKDRLTGSLSASHSTINLVTLTDRDVVFDNETEMGDVRGLTLNESKEIQQGISKNHIAQGNITGNVDKLFTTLGFNVVGVSQEQGGLSPDFYTRTGNLDGQYAEVDINGYTGEYLYIALDLKTYLEINHGRYLREVEPSGLYTKSTLLKLIDRPEIHFNLNGVVPKSKEIQFKVQLLNISTKTWDTLHGDTMNIEYKEGKLNIENINQYLSDKGLIFSRVRYGRSTDGEDYKARVDLFEIAFMKDMGLRSTSFEEREASTQATIGTVLDSNTLLNKNHEIDLNASINSNKNLMHLKNKIWGTDFEEE